MSRNIKEIGKELMGKSLNSFHRKTGLTQLEENNKMQDGILDGILSQVDDAYIEKTEQSNVIHLDGSGDGVVVVDSIEGNTKVNLIKKITSPFSRVNTTNKGDSDLKLNYGLKPNTKYTRIINVTKIVLGSFDSLMMCDSINNADGGYKQYTYSIKNKGLTINEFTTSSIGTIDTYVINPAMSHFYEGSGTEIEISDIMILEGSIEDNKCINSYFEGLQSSFEEKVNDDGKYEIEILSRCSNLINTISNVHEIKPIYSYYGDKLNEIKPYLKYFNLVDSYVNCNNLYDYYYTDNNTNIWINLGERDKDKALEVLNNKIAEGLNKSNKIKLLINEPLRSVHNVKDRLCIKDNKLVVERNVFGKVFDGTEDLWLSKITDSTINVSYGISATLTENSLTLHMCDRLPNVNHGQWDKPTIGTHCKKTNIYFNIPLNWLGGNTLNDVKQYLVNQYNQGTPMKIVHILNEPIYEEVLNEYGEPILLEGYENGTIYIDSTIVPTTTVRYTPKMESFKTLKEVENNNIMLTNDVNDNIIPYMMDVDLMIMEKEMALMSQYKIRRIGAKDMTSMQKRTQDMLTRLIKGKTLTEQECKTRVVTYLDAGKITDAQADELMLLISEVYA